MKKLTLELTDEAYEELQEAVQAMCEDLDEKPLSVKTWLQTELNENTEVIVEMLLSDY
jgi:hypothetical protein